MIFPLVDFRTNEVGDVADVGRFRLIENGLLVVPPADPVLELDQFDNMDDWDKRSTPELCGDDRTLCDDVVRCIVLRR